MFHGLNHCQSPIRPYKKQLFLAGESSEFADRICPVPIQGESGYVLSISNQNHHQNPHQIPVFAISPPPGCSKAHPPGAVALAARPVPTTGPWAGRLGAQPRDRMPCGPVMTRLARWSS